MAYSKKLSIETTINGEKFTKLDDVPQEFQYLMKDENQDGRPDYFEKELKDAKVSADTTTKIIIKTAAENYKKQANPFLQLFGVLFILYWLWAVFGDEIQRHFTTFRF